MKETKVLKVMIVIFAIVLTMVILMPTAFAASNLQSNPTTGSALQTKKATDWIRPIREMEQGYADSGDLEELNSDLTSVTSNNIDVHMMKTTEYGAMAILSASEYGKGNKVVTTTKGDNSGSTTGNKTGVIIDTKVWEWTASTGGDNWVNERYFDKYNTGNISAKIGDALIVCNYWHGATATVGLSKSYDGVYRGNGGIFSTSGNDRRNNSQSARGVAVCGENF